MSTHEAAFPRLPADETELCHSGLLENDSWQVVTGVLWPELQFAPMAMGYVAECDWKVGRRCNLGVWILEQIADN